MNSQTENSRYGELTSSIREMWGGPIVFTNGCFDIIHPGHIFTLEYAATRARQLGGPLVVGINSDNSTARLKGKGRPVMNETARVTVLRAIRGVDFVVVFDEDTPQELIMALQPALIIKGADYLGKQIVGSLVTRVETGPVESAFSTTKIIEGIRGR